MPKFIALLPFLFATSVGSAAVKSSCLKAISGDRPVPTADARELATISDWIDARTLGIFDYPESLPMNPDFQNFLTATEANWDDALPGHREMLFARFIAGEWRRWNDVRDQTRAAYLGLELDLLRAHPRRAVIELDGRARLAEISAKNADRLISDLRAEYRTADLATPEARARIEQAVNDVDLHFLSSERAETESAAHGPMASTRELARIGLDVHKPFFSSVVGGSPSVPFQIAATEKGGRLYATSQELARTLFRVNAPFARENGLIVPYFPNIKTLLTFFSTRAPEAVETVFRASDVGAEIDTIDKFISHLDPAKMAWLFPESSLFARLTPVRVKLIDYVMTTADGERFIREAFTLHLLYLSVNDPGALELQLQTMAEPGGMQRVFIQNLLPFIGWPSGFSLHIPVSVPASEIEAVRIPHDDESP